MPLEYPPRLLMWPPRHPNREGWRKAKSRSLMALFEQFGAVVDLTLPVPEMADLVFAAMLPPRPTKRLCWPDSATRTSARRVPICRRHQPQLNPATAFRPRTQSATPKLGDLHSHGHGHGRAFWIGG